MSNESSTRRGRASSSHTDDFLSEDVRLKDSDLSGETQVYTPVDTPRRRRSQAMRIREDSEGARPVDPAPEEDAPASRAGSQRPSERSAYQRPSVQAARPSYSKAPVRPETPEQGDRRKRNRQDLYGYDQKEYDPVDNFVDESLLPDDSDEDDDFYAVPRRRRRILPIVLITVFVLILLALAALLFVPGLSKSVLPPALNKQFSDAFSFLKAEPTPTPTPTAPPRASPRLNAGHLRYRVTAPKAEVA